MAPQLPDGVQLLRTLTGQRGMMGRIGWSPDGRLLATPSTDGTVRIWNTDSGVCLRTIRRWGESMFAAAFDLDGRILATGSSGGISLWDVDSGKLRNRFTSGVCHAVVFSPRGRIGASMNGSYVVTLWDLSTRSALCRITGPASMVSAVALDGEGGMLATGDPDGIVRLWAIPSGKHLRTLDGHSKAVMSIAFHPRGGILASEL